MTSLAQELAPAQSAGKAVAAGFRELLVGCFAEVFARAPTPVDAGELRRPGDRAPAAEARAGERGAAAEVLA